uniref:LRRCT domain-containing protein n=1 Tax=Panagrellus redivivus TaxID=6233 RepID=A0A7E4VLW5_PANRE
MCQCMEVNGGAMLNCSNTDADELIAQIKAHQTELGVIAYLTIEKTEIKHLPANYFSGLYIKQLYLIENGLQDIDDSALRGLESLQELVISRNNLTRVPVAALSKLNNLQILDMTYNNFRELDETDALPPLSKLYDVNFAYNKISNIPKTFFESNKNNLQTINLAHNHMTTVPAAALRGFRKLIALHLKNNRFTSLPKLTFMNLPVLKVLNLANNRIESIDRQAIMNVPNLRYFYLTQNKLTTILPFQFKGFEQLELLDLTGNQLSTLGANTFSHLSAVKQLFLGDNKIASIDSNAFTNSTISILILEGNLLREVTNTMFNKLPVIQQLSLKDNRIKVVDTDAFANATTLKLLDLSKNDILDLAPSTFLSQANLLLVDLSSNKLIRTPYAAFSRRVATVLLHENPLVCTENVHMLQQGLGVYVAKSEDKICAGKKSIEAVVAQGPEVPTFQVENPAPQPQIPQQNSFGQDPEVPQVDPNPLPSLQKSIRPINIHSIPSPSNQRTPSEAIPSNVIRPLNANPLSVPPRSDESPMVEDGADTKPDDLDVSSKPESNSTLPYPDDPDHPDNHPERYYPIPVPFLKTPPKMHPAYTITQTLPPSIVIAEKEPAGETASAERMTSTRVRTNEATDSDRIEKFEMPVGGFDETNDVHEGERRAYELDDQQTATRASQKLPVTVMIICLSTVGLVMLAVFVGLCVARQRNTHFLGSSSSSTTARSHAHFATQMNQMYGTLPHQRVGTLPRQSAQEDIYNWIYNNGGYTAYTKT